RKVVVGVQLDVRLEDAQRIGGRGGQFVLQRILLHRAVILAEVIDASVGLGGGARLHEVGNRNGRQEANDGHHDHDFHQGEARLARGSVFHTNYFPFRPRGVSESTGSWL